MKALAKLHIAKKDLGLEDGDYRDILERLTGQRTAKGLTEPALVRVIEELRAKGWKPQFRAFKVIDGGRGAAKPTRALADNPMAKKARALWLSLWHLGVVREPSERALEAFAARQMGCDRMQWADQGQSYKLIEALKAMAARAGWSQDVGQLIGADAVKVLKRQLIKRQCEILGDVDWKFSNPTADQLDEAIAALGQRIRASKESPDDRA